MCFWRESAGLYCFLCTLSISCPVHVAAPQMAYRPFEVSRSASKQALKVILHPTCQVGRRSYAGQVGRGGGPPISHSENITTYPENDKPISKKIKALRR